MFDQVAARYDAADAVMTFGFERYWRSQVRRCLGLAGNKVVLDLAAGTGTSSAALAKTINKVVACDFSEGMIAKGQSRLAGTKVAFVGGDATRLPFADDTFDAVTISFGLRNVVDLPKALSQMRRVTKPGGRLLVLEFSHPPNKVVNFCYRLYSKTLLPILVKLVTPHQEPYRYLTDSIKAWPNQTQLAKLISQAGWQSVKWRNLTGGVVAMHAATAPHLGQQPAS